MSITHIDPHHHHNGESIVSRTKLRLVHGAIGLASQLLCVVLIYLTGTLLSAGNPAATPILALLVMTELCRAVINLRWLHVAAQQKNITLPGQNNPAEPSVRLKPCVGSALLTLAGGVGCAFAVCILFGAPLLDKHAETLTLAALLVAVSLLPLVLFVGPLGAVQYLFCDYFELSHRTETAYLQLVQRHALFALFGAWASSACSVLDWDRDWQTYPVPNVCGVLLGLVAGNACTLGEPLWGASRRWLHMFGLMSENPRRRN